MEVRTLPAVYDQLRLMKAGNVDIKNLSRGSKSYLPVLIPGAGFSVGDLHFSQGMHNLYLMLRYASSLRCTNTHLFQTGDGEISFCGAIEMSGVITFKFTVMKSGMENLGMKSPIFLPGPVEPHFGPGRYLTFEGFSVDEYGKQHYLDATVAYRQACLRVIEYLRRFGYDDYQSYLLLSCAPIQGHVGAMVDVSSVSFLLPLRF